MQKLVSLILALAFSMTVANAEPFTKTLTSLGVNKGAVSVSIKKVKNGDVLYALNDKAPRTPASTLKLITTSAVVDTLGLDYVLSTKLYKSTNNDLYLKLIGDPLLTTNDLEKIIATAKAKSIVPKDFYIDDSIFDKVEWGEGWQWDDDLNPLIPKYSAYNINKNLVKIQVIPTSQNLPAEITTMPFYPITFMNLVTTDLTTKTKVKMERNLDLAPNVLNLEGTVKNVYTISIPVMSTKRNFILRLEDTIKSKKFEYYNPIKVSILPVKNIYLVDSIDRNLTDVIKEILKNSDNLAAESIFKLAGSVWADSKGSSENSMAMLNEYLKKKGIEFNDIRIVDGSGVSKNNLVNADFMTEFLIKRIEDSDYELFKESLPAPGEGTLTSRMLYFKDNLRAKTGTLSDVSAIAGYLVSRRGEVFAFDIMIQDAKTSSMDKKNIEEQILRVLYSNY